MWSPAAALVVLLLASLGPASPAEDPGAEGLKALEARQYEVAAQCFTKAVAADPKDFTAHFNLALAYSMLGKDAEAIAGYKKVLELKPGLPEAELNLGIVLLQEKRAAEALPYLESRASGKPKEPRPRLYLSRALLETGDLAKAEESFRTAVELDPKSAAAELGLAQTLARQNRLPDADPHFRRAAELDPSYRDRLLELAELYQKAGRTDAAIPLYQQFPENVAVRERLGQLLMEAGKPAEAIAHLEWAVKQSPTPANRLALAQAYRQNREPEKELPLLAQAVDAEPGNLDLRMAYARELRGQRNFAEAARQFVRVAQARPDSAPVWIELAGVLALLDNYPQTLAALDRAKLLGAETPGLLFLRAISLDHVGDYKGALAAYQEFLAKSQGKYPDEEFKARQRLRVVEKVLNKR
jgi:tetratricopeptide (TPR) repeat protein